MSPARMLAVSDTKMELFRRPRLDGQLIRLVFLSRFSPLVQSVYMNAGENQDLEEVYVGK